MNKGHETKIQYLKPSQVKTDYAYQRVVPEREIKAILENWNYDLVNMPKVSQRIDGSYYVVDGQHTLAAWKIHENDMPIKCKVFIGLSYDEEVELFIQQFGIAKNVYLSEKFRARFNRGDKEIVEMVNAVKAAGVEVSFTNNNKTNNKTAALGACKNGVKRLGPQKFTSALTILKDAWGGEAQTLSAAFINGIVELYDTNEGQFDRERLVNVLGKKSPIYFTRMSKEHFGSASKRYAAAFRGEYNRAVRKNKLVAHGQSV